MAPGDGRLHVTNGDSAAATIVHAVQDGDEVLAWRDVLHEGPVPQTSSEAALRAVRARFLASRGWSDAAAASADLARRDAVLEKAAANSRPIVLWFEHDLYDQLQLLQVLDRLATERPALEDVSLISIDRFAGHERFTGLGELDAKELASLWPRRRPVLHETTELAQTAWSAFRAPDPAALAALAVEDGLELPFLAAALRRLLEELPAPADGLGRSERQILQAVADGAHTPREVFQAAQAEEQAPFAGDWTIWWAIASLAAAPRALLHTADGAPLPPPPPARGGEAFLRSRIALTVDGEDVLAGRADQLGLRQVDRWVGGLELAGPSVWRWDAERSALLAPEA